MTAIWKESILLSFFAFLTYYVIDSVTVTMLTTDTEKNKSLFYISMKLVLNFSRFIYKSIVRRTRLSLVSAVTVTIRDG